MNLLSSHKANVLRSLLFFLFALNISACAQSAPATVPNASPTTRVVIVVATNPPATATKISSPTLVPSNTPTSTATLESTATRAPTQAPTRIPPTRVPSTATKIPPTLAPTTQPTSRPSDQPTIRPTDQPTLQPTTEPPATQFVAATTTTQPPSSFSSTELVVISEGTLKMGGKAEGDDPDEKPFHDVEMYEFRIEKYEVTNAQYQACVAAGVCPAPTKNSSYTRVSYFGNPEFANFPVTNVTWHGADAYCKWTGRRLPHEGEWERAAKGVENWRYTWSNSIGMHFEWNAIFHGSPISFCEASCPIQNYWGDVNDGFPDTAPVGWFSPFDSSSGFGVIDMAGNVAEWTNTWYDANAYANGNDIYGPSEATGTKVVRGGSWADEPRRNSDREPQSLDYSSDRIGFRCAQ